MKKIFLTIITTILFTNLSFAEVINLQTNDINFGEWRLICENDVMIDAPYCKIASKFYQNQAAIIIDLPSKFNNQMVMVIPNLTLGSTVQIRIDKNDIIFANQTKKDDFGLVMLSPSQKTTILSQIKKGDFLFIRFNINGSEKEITVKLNLTNFRSAISHYNSTFSK